MNARMLIVAAILARPAAVSGQWRGRHVTNAGRRVGSDVVQLYLAFPESAGEPPRQLRGFDRVRLVGGEKDVAFDLGPRALSI
jgi:beta-glucosidase